MNHTLTRWKALRRTTCVVAALVLALGTVTAQSVIVPNSVATTPTGLWLNSVVRQLPRTIQMGLAAQELSSIPVGASIVGLSMRAGIHTSNPATWPATAATWQNYEITLAEAAVPLSQWSTTCAQNMKNPILVRSGPLTIPAGTWQNLGGPGSNPFDTFYYGFQKPYTYKGGDLVIHITHDGNNVASAIYQERAADQPTGHGVGAYASTFRSATVTSRTGPMVTRIHWGIGAGMCVGTGGYAPFLIVSHSLVKPTPPPGTVNFAITNGLGGASGFLMIGLLRTSIPLPNGCSLLVAPIVGTIPFWFRQTGPGNGRQDFTLTFPASVLGAFELQAAILDPGAKGGYVGTNSAPFTMKP